MKGSLIQINKESVDAVFYIYIIYFLYTHRMIPIVFSRLVLTKSWKRNGEATDRPLQTRYDQKMAKYGRVAEQSNLRFVPAVFSHTGQIHGEFKAFVKEQIKQKLVAFEGDAKASKTRSVMKWWSKCICICGDRKNG